MLTFPIPKSLHGQGLSDQLKAAGLPALVRIEGDRLIIEGATDQAAVQRVIDAHVPPPPPADPEAEFRKALEAATTVAAIRDALLGKTGPGAEPRRPDNGR